jgi:DNA-binding IclR family transcriptional regulator
LPSDALVARIQGEFREMPGLRLTVAEACRLWQLDASTCTAIVDALVVQGFLVRRRDGAFVALPATPKALKVDHTSARVTRRRHVPP